MTLISMALFLLIFLGACAVVCREGFFTSAASVFGTVAALTAAFAVRVFLLDSVTDDYTNFLSVWVQYFRDNGGFAGIADIVGNYNLPYLYFLALFSYIPIDDLYLIKYLSIIFDVVLAWGIGRIVFFFTDSIARQRAAFLAAMFLPTVVLNSAWWGQCDSIFASFCVISLYHALNGRSKLSLAFAALALSFKVQAVFFLPIFGVLLLTGLVRVRDVWVFPAVFVATLLPGILLGHPIGDALTIYLRQVDGATGVLNYNSASIYAFIPYNYSALWLDYAEYIGIALAVGLVYTTMLWTVARYRSTTLGTVFGFAVLLALGIPLFLPYMHERYFYLADVLTLALAFVSPASFPACVLCLFGSLLGYYAYINGVFLLPMAVGAVAMVAAFAVICAYIHKSFVTPELDYYEE